MGSKATQNRLYALPNNTCSTHNPLWRGTDQIVPAMKFLSWQLVCLNDNVVYPLNRVFIYWQHCVFWLTTMRVKFFHSFMQMDGQLQCQRLIFQMRYLIEGSRFWPVFLSIFNCTCDVISPDCSCSVWESTLWCIPQSKWIIIYSCTKLLRLVMWRKKIAWFTQKSTVILLVDIYLL